MSEDKTLEELEANVKSSRHVDKRQKWILFWLVGVVTALSIGLLALYLDTRGQAEASAEVAVTEQQEKVEVVTEARQALCGDKDQEIYDRELCEKWAGIAESEPLPVSEDPTVVIGGPSQADIVEDGDLDLVQARSSPTATSESAPPTGSRSSNTRTGASAGACTSLTAP